MTVFKYFWKIVYAQKLAILVYVGIFLAITLFMANTNQDFGDFTASTVPIAVINEDESTLSDGLSDYLAQQHTMVELENDETTIQQALFLSEVSYVLIIPNGFGDDFTYQPQTAALQHVQLPNSASGIYLNTQIDNFLQTIRAYLQAGFSTEQALNYAKTDLAQAVIVEFADDANWQSPYFFRFLPFTILTVLIFAVANVFFTFNQEEIARRNACGALSFKDRNFQLTIGCLITAIGGWAVFMAIAFVLYREEMLYVVSVMRMVNTLALTLTGVSIGFLIGQLIKQKRALNTVAMLITMVFAYLSGVFMPQEFLDERLLMIARFTMPTYWYIRTNDILGQTAVASAQSVSVFWQGVLIQIGFAAAIFTITLVVTKEKKSRAVMA